MAHEFESGFVVKQQAWHGLAKVLDGAPSVDDAIREAGLDWDLLEVPLKGERVHDDGVELLEADAHLPVVADREQHVGGSKTPLLQRAGGVQRDACSTQRPTTSTTASSPAATRASRRLGSASGPSSARRRSRPAWRWPVADGRTIHEMAGLEGEAEALIDVGLSAWPGLSYEEGVRDACRWFQFRGHHPFQVEKETELRIDAPPRRRLG